MRIWSLHPRYLDAKGIVALWREALLAKHVLEGKTKGYKNHPQLNRFKRSGKPVDAINAYLAVVYEEAERRGYHFDKTKIGPGSSGTRLKVQSGQLEYEFRHLLKKLEARDKGKFTENRKVRNIEAHRLFDVVEGPVEAWEVL